MEDQSKRAAKRICGGLNESSGASEHRNDEANEVEWLKQQLGIKQELIEQMRAKLDAPFNDVHHQDQSSHQIASISSRGTRFNTPSDQNVSEGYERMLHAIHTWAFETTNNMTKRKSVPDTDQPDFDCRRYHSKARRIESLMAGITYASKSLHDKEQSLLAAFSCLSHRPHCDRLTL